MTIYKYKQGNINILIEYPYVFDDKVYIKNLTTNHLIKPIINKNGDIVFRCNNKYYNIDDLVVINGGNNDMDIVEYLKSIQVHTDDDVMNNTFFRIVTNKRELYIDIDFTTHVSRKAIVRDYKSSIIKELHKLGINTVLYMGGCIV